MRTPWKIAVIGGEVTMLVAFTGVGLHLAMQSHRSAFHPPPLVLPTHAVGTVPQLATGVGTPATVPLRTPAPSPAPSPTPLVAGLVSRFGHNDHNLLVNQWDILQRLMTAVESYLQEKLRSAPGAPH